ncbi:MAG: Fur family transcriptional regulator [Chloroflexota bacterium]|nr:Fur family transcriptional regulator [Chloroflexota bacterium]
MLLKKQGLRLTPQRLLVLDIIHEFDGPFTAEEVLRQTQARMSGVDKSTVYRTLELLEGLGSIYGMEVGGRTLYHHVDDMRHHHHLVCRKCGKSMDCDEGLFVQLEALLEDKYGFRVDFKHMVIGGLCRECASEG